MEKPANHGDDKDFPSCRKIQRLQRLVHEQNPVAQFPTRHHSRADNLGRYSEMAKRPHAFFGIFGEYKSLTTRHEAMLEQKKTSHANGYDDHRLAGKIA